MNCIGASQDLRPNEGRELKRSDFCCEDRTLFIRKNKSYRERLIPVSDDVAEMCRDYMNKSIEIYPDTEYMFPSLTGKPYQKRWLADTFLRLWAASNPEKCHVKVRVYLLRRRYATAVYTKWLDSFTARSGISYPYICQSSGEQAQTLILIILILLGITSIL